MRLLITITPTAWTRPAAAARRARRPSRTAVPEGVVGAALAELAGYPECGAGHAAPTTGCRASGGSASRAAGAAGRLRLDVPPDEQLREGPASLLAHSHDEQLWSLRSVVVTGELVEADGWTFKPDRIIGDSGPATPLAIIGRLRDSGAPRRATWTAAHCPARGSRGPT